jgi:hypothetical protein
MMHSIITSASPWWPLAVGAAAAGNTKRWIPIPFEHYLQWHHDFVMRAQGEQPTKDALAVVRAAFN